MLVICQHCESRFKVADDAIGPNGRAVRCSSCNHQWIEVPSPATGPSGVRNIVSTKPPTLSRLPFYEYSEIRGVIYILCILSVLALLAGLFVTNPEFLVKRLQWLPFINDITKFYNSNGLKLETVDCKITQASDSVELSARIIVRNTSEQNRMLDFVRFTILDDKKNNIGDLVINLAQDLKPNETETIEGKFNSLPKEAKFAVIEISNIIDLKIRKISGAIQSTEIRND